MAVGILDYLDDNEDLRLDTVRRMRHTAYCLTVWEHIGGVRGGVPDATSVANGNGETIVVEQRRSAILDAAGVHLDAAGSRAAAGQSPRRLVRICVQQDPDDPSPTSSPTGTRIEAFLAVLLVDLGVNTAGVVPEHGKSSEVGSAWPRRA